MGACPDRRGSKRFRGRMASGGEGNHQAFVEATPEPQKKVYKAKHNNDYVKNKISMERLFHGTIGFHEAMVTGNLISEQAIVQIGWGNQKGVSMYVNGPTLQKRGYGLHYKESSLIRRISHYN